MGYIGTISNNIKWAQLSYRTHIDILKCPLGDPRRYLLLIAMENVYLYPLLGYNKDVFIDTKITHYGQSGHKDGKRLTKIW